MGLAVCDRTLTLSEVERHDKLWQVGQGSSSSHPGLLALYPFDEHSGSIAHNRIDSTTNLRIPSRFFVLHPRFLTPTWREYRPGPQYWQDVSTNIVGFIPLGLVAYGYFSDRRTMRPAAIALVVGFCTSLTIELLQGVLPTRTSGTTDILTNTLGTGIGILLCRSFSSFREGPIGGSDCRA
jgi:VanZ family protein